MRGLVNQTQLDYHHKQAGHATPKPLVTEPKSRNPNLMSLSRLVSSKTDQETPTLPSKPQLKAIGREQGTSSSPNKSTSTLRINRPVRRVPYKTKLTIDS